MRDRAHFLLLNIGHFLDHLFTLIFATVAALALHREWGVGYAELLVYATPGFFAFGVFALPAGWLADHWSRDGMMVVFFTGIGAASILTGFAQNPFQVGVGLFVIGLFAAIYHPVGLAIVSMKWKNIGMRIAVNGVWGNLGVASAALLTGFLIDQSGWRMAFVFPGIVSILLGLAYLILQRGEIHADRARPAAKKTSEDFYADPAIRRTFLIVSGTVFLTTAFASVNFQATTFALPKMLDERVQGLAQSLAGWGAGDKTDNQGIATVVGFLAFLVFSVASVAQLIVGALLDRVGPRRVYMTVAGMQLIFFALMPGLMDTAALAVALGFTLGTFGQIPINDYMIGKMASGAARARVYGVRYVVSFSALAASLPLIAFVHESWGFDMLFRFLAATSMMIFVAVTFLPKRLPSADAKPSPAE